MLLVPLGLLLVMSGFAAVGLIIGELLLALLVHKEDPFLSLHICVRDADSNVGDDGGVTRGNPLLDGTYQDAPFTLVVPSTRQLSLLFQLLEVDGGRIGSHTQLAHLFLVDFFNGQVTELFLEQVTEVFPARIAVAGSSMVSIIVVVIFGWCIPVFLSKVYPPALGVTLKVRGGEDHHE